MPDGEKRLETEARKSINLGMQEVVEEQEQRNTILNPQAQQMEAGPAQLELEQEEVLNAAQLKEELEKLDNAFSSLGVKEKTKIKRFKSESAENENFVARYKSRNALIKKMTQAVGIARVRIAKTDMAGGGQPLGEEDLRQLNTLVKEAKTAKEQIKSEDVSLRNWKVYEENKEAMDQLMDEIVEESNRLTDSPTYHAVVKAIGKYRENKTPQNFAKLQKKVAEYIRIRTKNGTKGEEKFKPKGRVRIRRMKDLAARLGIWQNGEAYRNRAQMTEASKIRYRGTAADDTIDQRTEKLKIANQRMQEALAVEKQFHNLKVASQIMITDSMLEPEYVVAHLDEMKEYARLFSLAKACKENWIQKQRQRPNNAVKTQLEIYEDRVYSAYEGKTEETLAVYEKLDDYIRACELKDQQQIRALRDEMNSKGVGGPTEEGKELCREYYDDLDRRQMEQFRLEYIVGAYGQTRYGASLSTHKSRMMSALNGIRLNEQGRFASEKDRENFEKDFALMDALYNGSVEELFEVVEAFIEKTPMLPMNESITREKYIKEHFVKLANIVDRDVVTENMKGIRPDVSDLFDKRKGRDYMKKIDVKRGGLGKPMGNTLPLFARQYGFSFHTQAFKNAFALDLDEEMLQDNLNEMKNIIREHKKRNQENK